MSDVIISIFQPSYTDACDCLDVDSVLLRPYMVRDLLDASAPGAKKKTTRIVAGWRETEEGIVRKGTLAAVRHRKKLI